MEGHTHNNNDKDEYEEDIYSQLEQKERDLVLAAELGKALLERTEELSRINEQTVEEYSASIEELEQERYHLKMRLESVNGEYENTVRELQWDLAQLRQQINDQQQQAQEIDKDRSQVIRELTQQNERLTEQLRKTAISEEEVGSEVQSLRDQLTSRRTSMHDHIHQLEVLQEEIGLLTGSKHEVERRLALVMEERDGLACSLEESQERVLMLAKQKHDQDQQLRITRRDIEELQASNAQLEDQVENISQRVPRVDFNQSQNLFSELSQLSDCTDVDMGSKSPQLPYSSRPHSLIESDWLDEEEIECDDNFDMAVLANSSLDSELMHCQNTHSQENELRKELVEAYQHLRCMCRDIRRRNTGKDEEVQRCQSVQAGQLNTIIHDLRMLIQSTINQECESEASSPLYEDMKTKIGELQTELSTSKHQVVQLTRQVQLKDEDLKHKTNQLTEFMKQLSVHQQEMGMLRSERDQLQDNLLGELSLADILQQTRGERDGAIETKNQLEMELAKSKIDLVSLNSQLMEAIQQKVELSQKLDQWEVDMHEVLGLQMQKRIEEDCVREKAEAELELSKQDQKQANQKKGFFTFNRQ